MKKFLVAALVVGMVTSGSGTAYAASKQICFQVNEMQGSEIRAYNSYKNTLSEVTAHPTRIVLTLTETTSSIMVYGQRMENGSIKYGALFDEGECSIDKDGNGWVCTTTGLTAYYRMHEPASSKLMLLSLFQVRSGNSEYAGITDLYGPIVKCEE